MARTYILAGPQGIGKTTHAAKLALLLGCTTITDEWNGRDSLQPETLAITNADDDTPPSGATLLRVKDADELAKLISDLER